ncbi:MAG: formate dehydrogenase family accessory protein FdhD [Deltaproteobacteria bacterium]|nr:MAG: formate dehydrogenase family accessory protein FdhD [Deltaproteobacteria bacterium]
MTNQITLKHAGMIITPHGKKIREEEIAIETPYTVALNDEVIGASMVLTTNLEEFGAGFLFGQGYIKKPGEIKEIIVCPEGRIAVYADVDMTKPKEVIITSGCGGTGKIPKEMLEGAFEPLQEFAMNFASVKKFVLAALNKSDLGSRTHCVHGCGLWQDEQLKLYYEDVGRHNAVDKMIGAIMLGKASPKGAVYTTGRLTSDMVLKCSRVGIPIIMSRTSTSSLGIAIAKQAGATLIAYARPDRLNVINAPERILS